MPIGSGRTGHAGGVASARFHGPRDYLDAARSPETTPETLTDLATSEYVFVRLAVAENPATPPDALRMLMPTVAEDWNDYEMMRLLALNANAPSDVAEQVAEVLPSILHRCDAQNGFAAGLAIFKRADVEFQVLQRLLDDPRVTTTFRKVVARERHPTGVSRFGGPSTAAPKCRWVQVIGRPRRIKPLAEEALVVARRLWSVLACAVLLAATWNALRPLSASTPLHATWSCGSVLAPKRFAFPAFGDAPRDFQLSISAGQAACAEERDIIGARSMIFLLIGGALGAVAHQTTRRHSADEPGLHQLSGQ